MPIHPISPVFDEHSQILILGSFPSVQSRAQGFFYGHPQNRFWRVLAAVMQDAPPCTVAERRAFLLRHRIAVWDVIASCDIVGSSDAKIRNAEVNDLSPILSAAPIQQIFVNGQTAARLYHRWTEPLIHRPAIPLPSTSPANATWSLERLVEAWRIIRLDAGRTDAPVQTRQKGSSTP